MSNYVKKWKGIPLLCVTLAIVFSGCSSNSPSVAKIGNSKISLERLNERLAQLPETVEKNEETEDSVLNQLINEELFYKAARSAGYTKSKEYKQKVRQFKRNLLISMVMNDEVNNNVSVSDNELRGYYENNINQFEEIEQRNASHILVDNEKEANKILRAVRRGNNFDQLAKEKSLDNSKEKGGEIGWFTRGQLLPEFDEAVFEKGSEGLLSNVVETNLGFHVIKLNEIKVIPQRTFEQVRDSLKNAMTEQKRNVLAEELLIRLKGKYQIEKITD